MRSTVPTSDYTAGHADPVFAVIQVACRGSSAESAGSPLERVRALVVSPNRAAGSAASGGPAILVRDSSKTGMDE